MSQNKIATLNLTKSLDDFQQTVIKLLELDDVEKWDGSTLRCREQKTEQCINFSRRMYCFITVQPITNERRHRQQPLPKLKVGGGQQVLNMVNVGGKY